MAIWAIADFHLSFGVPNKLMDVFGEKWKDHAAKIESAWRELISPDDLVLIPGDISWGMHLEEALPDLLWIDKLPGTKVMIKGNHDYWWGSLSKVKSILPPSCHLIQNDSFKWKDVAIAGARMWDTREFGFNGIIDITTTASSKPLTVEDHSQESQKVFLRELGRLEMSLKAMEKAQLRIVMTHYPPISADLKDSEVSRLLEKYGVNICVFGHLHNVKQGIPLFGEHNGIRYHLTACDYLNFIPLKVYE